MHASFTGNSRRTRNVNLSGQNRNPFATAWQPTGASQTVSQAQAERQKRQIERDRLHASRQIQRTWRGFRVRKALRESRRLAFDEVYENELDPETRVQAALPLLLAAFRSSNTEDRRRLVQLVADIHQVGVHRLISNESLFSLRRLVTILVTALEWRNTVEPDTFTKDCLFEVLEQITALSPQSLTGIISRYYKMLAQATEALSLSSDRTMQRAVVAPLDPTNNESVQAYSSFAVDFLGKEGLALNTLEGTILSRQVDLEKLAVSIVDLHTHVRRGDWPAESQLWLLANFIDLHRARLVPSERLSYLRALQLQLASLVGQISLRYSAKPGASIHQAGKDAQGSQPTALPLPEYVMSRVSALVDREGISALLAELTSNALNAKGASLLAGYIIILIRCFPAQGDDIRMGLFLGDVASETGQLVPVIKVLWNSAQQTKVYRQIEGDKNSATTELVRSYLTGNLGPYSSEDGEWRLILLFLELYVFILRLSDDDDFFSCVQPSHLPDPHKSRLRSCGLAMDEIKSLTTFLKNIAFALIYNGPGILHKLQSAEASADARLHTYFSHASEASPAMVTDGQRSSERSQDVTKLDLQSLRGVITTPLRMLYDRDSRRPFLPINHWLMTSRFDMSKFVDAVVAEQERQQQELADKEAAEDDDEDEDSDVAMSGDYAQHHTMSGQRLSRHAQIEWRRQQQKGAHRDRMLSIIGPKLEVLKHIPFVIPFATRLEIFRKFVETDKMRRRDGMDAEAWRMSMHNNWNPLLAGNHQPGRHRGTIVREREFVSAFEQFYELGESLKEPIQIQFIDKFSNVEAGIDGGGVTKEFLISAIENVSSPEGGELFVANQQGLVYPNPIALDRLRDIMQHATPSEIGESTAELLQMFEFLGRLVGKCLYEGILVDITFAGFFLLKWATGPSGENSYRGNLNDLRDLDEDLYRGMLNLKNYDGNVADLGLDFTIDDQISGPGEPTKTISRPLRFDGKELVTNDNRLLYISYVARHRLVMQPLAQTAAFLRGLRSMIAPSWLSMFNQNEVQRLVGGDSSEIDIDDLERNTVYSGAYDMGDHTNIHPTIPLFWKVVRTFADEERRLLLKYVTSTPRAPLLGFSQLNPRFSIRDSGSDDERLPSTSTCVNLLKLPMYKDEDTLRQKLLLAIHSGAGFDLS